MRQSFTIHHISLKGKSHSEPEIGRSVKSLPLFKLLALCPNESLIYLTRIHVKIEILPQKKKTSNVLLFSAILPHLKKGNGNL